MLKKSFIIFAIVAGFVILHFTSCQKEIESNNQQELKSSFNPLSYIGKRHNLIVDEIIKKDLLKSNTNEISNKEEMLNEIIEITPEFEILPEEMKAYKEDVFALYNIAYQNSNKSNFPDILYKKGYITKNMMCYFEIINTDLKNNVDEVLINETIKNIIESLKIDTSLSESEKTVVFGYISVLKSSIEYWSTKKVNWGNFAKLDAAGFLVVTGVSGNLGAGLVGAAFCSLMWGFD